MDLIKAMAERHAVRSYLDKPIEADIRQRLDEFVTSVNEESGLNIQVVYDEPQAFDSRMAHYGNFSGVKNYIVLIGKKTPDFEEKTGYFGEKIVLFAQALGLNTCWVAMTYKKIKTAYTVNENEKLNVVIALGYGATEGVMHKSKTVEDVSNAKGDSPEWFKKGVEAALLAPTALNQQKFRFVLSGDTVTAKAGMGFYTKTDLGISKYHFELGAGKENFRWI